MGEFAPTLQHLEVDDCELLDIHTLGLSACTALTQLMLRDPCLMFNNTRVYMGRDLSLSPSNLGLLGQLHTLHLDSNEDVSPSLSWVSTLTSLRDLTIYAHSCDSSLTGHVLWLTNLTNLELCAKARPGDDDPVLNIDVGWDKLQALQALSLFYFRLQLGAGLGVGGLLHLNQMRDLSFDGSTIDGADSDCFAALMYNLARLRPQVRVSFRSGDLRTVFDRLC